MPALRHSYHRYRQSNPSIMRANAIRALAQPDLRSPILHLFNDTTSGRHHLRTLYGLQDLQGYVTDLTNMMVDFTSSIQAEANHLIEQEYRRMNDLEYFRRISEWARQHQPQNTAIFPPQAEQLEGPKCYLCKQRGHIIINCPQYLCKHCCSAAPGHRQRNCPSKPSNTNQEDDMPNLISASETSLSGSGSGSVQSTQPFIPPLPVPPVPLEVMVEMRRMVADGFEASGLTSHTQQTGRPSWASSRPRGRATRPSQAEQTHSDSTRTDSQNEQNYHDRDSDSSHNSRENTWPGSDESELQYPTVRMLGAMIPTGLEPNIEP